MEIKQQSESQEQDQQLFTLLRKNDLQIVPFINEHGEWILPDSFLAKIWQQVVDEDLCDLVWLEEDIGLEKFILMAKNPANLISFGFQGEVCLGFGWINQMNGNIAHAHFCMFREVHGTDTVDQIGHMFLDYWMAFPDAKGEPLFDVLFGTMPECNYPAQGFVQRMGFQYLGRVPGLFKDNMGARFDAHIYHYPRF